MATNAIASVRLLVVSREPAVLRPLWSIGESNCWHLETAGNGWEALEQLQAGAVPDLLLLGLSGTDGDGLHGCAGCDHNFRSSCFAPRKTLNGSVKLSSLAHRQCSLDTWKSNNSNSQSDITLV